MVSAFENKLQKRKNGRYYVKGRLQEVYNEIIGMMDILYPQNNTYHITTKTDECNKRFKNNESDFSTATLPQPGSREYRTPVPLMASKVSFATGYDTIARTLKVRDGGDAFFNFALLDASVYFYSLLLTLLFVLMVAFNTWMRWKRKKKKEASLVKLTLKNVMSVYYFNSDDFRVVSLLFVILSFYLVNSFKSVYKTSKIIVEEPFVVKNYHELLEDETALPVFYNPLTKISDQFEFAPKNSLRSQIWSKLLQRTGGNTADFFILGINNRRNLTAYMSSIFRKLDKQNYAIFGTTRTVELLKEFLCGISPEKELWQVFLFSDPSEHEDLLGFPLSSSSPNERYFIQGQRKFVEFAISNAFYAKVPKRTKLFAYALSNTTRAHRYLQDLVCRGHAMDPDVDVAAIKVGYFGSFCNFTLSLFIIARVVLAYEHVIAKNRPRRINLTPHYVLCERTRF